MDYGNVPNWDDLRVLLCFARMGSTLRAANRLRVSHQTVSRRLGNLENRLGARLIDRSTSPWQLTLVGEKIAAHAQEIETVMFSAGQSARLTVDDMSGRVRITSVHLGFELLLARALGELAQQYPLLEFDLVSEQAPANIQSGAFDIAVRFTNTPPGHLLGRQVGQISFGLYGTQELISALDRTVDLSVRTSFPYVDLVADRVHQTPGKTLPFVVGRTTIVSDLATLVSAVGTGMGVGFMPEIVARRQKHLFASKTVVAPDSLAVWILRNEDSRRSAKMRTIEAHLYQSMLTKLG